MEEEPRQGTEAASFAGATPAPEAAGSTTEGAGAAPAEPLPAATGDNVNGASDVAAKAEAEAKTSEDSADAVKKAYEGIKGISKLKPGYGGLANAGDVLDSGKAAVEAAQNGDASGAASNGLDAFGGGLKAIGPALQKLAPSVLSGVTRAFGPVGAGLQAGAAIGKAGDDASASNQTLQRAFQQDGSANADGSPTSITDSIRNNGDKAAAAVTRLTGSSGVGTAAGIATKVVGSIGNAPLIIGSAGVGAGKWAWNKGKQLLGLGDG
jgi:hypothetical protein